jgi:hypothetical protein
VNHALVFCEASVLLIRSAFRVETLDSGVQPAEVVATIDEGNLRKQQNKNDAENY